MPLQKLQFRPGLNREGTDYSNEGGWYDGDKIRFRSGFPEKIGGWSRLSGQQFIGLAKSLWNWVTLDGSNYLGVGTSKKYYIEQGGFFNNVTPIVHTSANIGAAAGPFTATANSTSLTVVDASYNPSAGDYVIISGAASLGGNLTANVLNTTYTVTSIVNATAYTITTSVAANASDTGKGGATVTINYEYPVGLDVAVAGTGWGSGPWGRSTWGSAFSGGVQDQLRLWSNDNYGQDLVIAPRGGPVFYWEAVNGPTVRAKYLSDLADNAVALTDTATWTGNVTSITVTAAAAQNIFPYMVITGTNIPAGTQVDSTYITGLTTVPITATTTGSSSGSYAFSYAGAFVPTKTNQVVASAIQRFVICFGANPYSPNDASTTFDPLLVRWSDQENPYQWIPEVTNQSGEFKLSNGSYIMCAESTRQEILVWTDSAIYSMQYLGPPYVWGFQILMDNISIISPNAAVTVNNITYWMGTDKFFSYSGRVETLPCSIWQYIFNDINTDQGFQVFAGSNERYSEVWWFYCSNDSDTVDKYVIYNYLERVWYYGTMARTAWLDSPLRSYPMAADYNNRILYHEAAVDDVAGETPVPINAYVQSSDFDIGDGHNFGFVWRILPDVNFNGSNVNQPQVTMTVKPRRNSGTPYGAADNPAVISSDNYAGAGVYNIQEFTGQVYTRLRGRQLAFRIESTTLGVSWQLGSPRIDIRNDGRR
jgi:hypothetical protein